MLKRILGVKSAKPDAKQAIAKVVKRDDLIILMVLLTIFQLNEALEQISLRQQWLEAQMDKEMRVARESKAGGQQ
jgi:hypothetical protein